VEAASVPGPFDVLGHCGAVGDRADERGQTLRPRLIEKRRSGTCRQDFIELAALVKAIAVRADTAMCKLFAQAGDSLDDDTRPAGDGIDAEGDARDFGPDHGLYDDGEGGDGEDRTGGRTCLRDLALIGRGVRGSCGWFPKVGPEAIAERGGQDAPDGIEERVLAADVEDGIEKAGERIGRRVLADHRGANGDRAVEASVGPKDGPARYNGDVPPETEASSGFKARAKGIRVARQIIGSGLAFSEWF
jgi:hypothetical protein